MGEWAGLGARIRQAIKERGFVNARGEPDVQRFAITHGWVPNYLYRWINETNTPDRENIDKLGVALNVSPPCLLFGDEVSKEPARPRKRVRRALSCLAGALLIATSGVPVFGGTIQVGDNKAECTLSELRRRYRYFALEGFPRLFPMPSWA